jgi:hypothetical protein
MEDFDITCTATLRPELLERTLSSFTKHLFRQCIERARLIINIDCAGADPDLKDKKINEILSVIDHYPFREVTFRIGDPPHFGHAFVWCMNQIETPLFFHLEEDWEMIMDIDFEEMMNTMDVDYKLVHLRLSTFVSGEKTCKNWNKFLDWNGMYFEVKPDERGVIGWAGHPSLNRSFFIQHMLKFINKDKNPEKQIKGVRGNHPRNDLFTYYHFGSFHPQNSGKAIIDIGRQWMVDKGYAKAGNKAFFTRWERSQN